MVKKAVLFSDRNWMNTSLDFSYHILPRKLFRYTLVYMISASCALNGLVFVLTGFRSKL